MKSFINRSYKGQSLVEMALVTPLLLIILLGLVEVGVLLRNYLAVANLSRELARTATRSNYVDPVEPEVGATKVLSNTLLQASEALPEFESRGALYLTVVRIETGMPCNPDTKPKSQDEMEFGCVRPEGVPTDTWKVYEDIDNELDCQLADPPGTWTVVDYWPSCSCDGPFWEADNVITTTPQVQTFGKTAGPILPVLRENDPAYLKDREDETEKLNCFAAKKNLRLRDGSHIRADVLYNSYQLFGFPFLSNKFTDPILLHAYTTMRITESRDD